MGWDIVGQREYNRVQRETLSLYREVEEGILDGAYEELNKEEPYEGLAINLSNAANVVLLILKVFANSNPNLSLGSHSSSRVANFKESEESPSTINLRISRC